MVGRTARQLSEFAQAGGMEEVAFPVQLPISPARDGSRNFLETQEPIDTADRRVF